MASSRVVYLFTLVVILIGSVKGRQLANLDRVNNINTTNVPFHRMSVTDLGSGKRCKSIYGFLPCADTLLESLFLIVIYTHVFMLAEEWLSKGSAALLIHSSNRKVAGSVFRVLKALPKIAMIIVPGALSTQSNARKQVDFAVAMNAGTTVITLTGTWAINVILNKEKFRETTSSHNNLSFLRDCGVYIQNDTRIMVIIMILSLIPFAIVLLLQVFIGHMMILLSLIVSALSLSSYVAYQIANPWIGDRTVTYLKQKHFQQMFLKKLQGLVDVNLYIKGEPNMKAIERIFILANSDDCRQLILEKLTRSKSEKVIVEADEISKATDESLQLTQEKLRRFIDVVFDDDEDKISKEYAFDEIIRQFDTDGSKGISMGEFRNGCKSWLNKWKESTNGLSTSETLCKKLLDDGKIKELLVLPKPLLHPLINNAIVKENGEIDENQIDKLISEYDDNKDDGINKVELEKMIKNMNLAMFDPGTVAERIFRDFDKNNSGKISKEEIITGVKEWVKKAKEHISDRNDLRMLIQHSANESWIISNVKEEPKRNILYVVLGAPIIYLFAKPFLKSVIQFSNALKIPFPFTSFVVAPFFLNARSMVIFAFSHSNRINSNKDGSLAFFELYSGLIMDNLMGLTSLLTIAYIRDLTWDYTPELITIIVITWVMGTFALTRKTYPLWTSFLSFFLYVTTTTTFCMYVWRRA